MKIRILDLAFKNLKRKYIRTLVLLLAVAVVTGSLLGATVFITGMKNALKIGTYRLGADILVVPQQYEAQAKSALLAGEPTSFYMDKSVFERVKEMEGVKRASAQLFIKPASFTCCFTIDTFLIAFDPESDFTIAPWLEKTLKRQLNTGEIITGRSMPVLVGDTLPFFGTPFKVVGTLEPTGMKFFDQSVFMTMESAYKMALDSKTRSMQPIDIPSDKISAVLVQVAENWKPDRVAIRIEHDIDGIKAIVSDEVINVVRKQLNGLIKGIFAISAVLWLLALVLMGFAFYMIVNERQRELGLLRSMGARKGQVFKLIMAEALIISLAGGVSGLLAGSALLFTFKSLIMHSMKLPYLLPQAGTLAVLMLGALAFSLLIGVMSSFLPAFMASRMEPYEAIRKGE